MKTLVLTLASMLSSVAWASSNFVSNPYLPYPPGCAQVPEMNAQGRLGEPAVSVFKGVVHAPNYPDPPLPVGLTVYRTPCQEHNRSLIWVVFTLNSEYANESFNFSIPYIGLQVPGLEYSTPIRLASEPNGWGTGTDIDRTDTRLAATQHAPLAGHDPLSDNRKRRWLFLIDNQSPMSEWWPYSDNRLSAEDYNGPLVLNIVRYDGQGFRERAIHVPATLDLWPQAPQGLPLSGRLSGNWVFEDASDQGVVLSVSGKMSTGPSAARNPDKLPMVIFLSHYTFDTDGEMLWLTGAAEFGQGENQVTMQIESVRNGEFRGDKTAQREAVGHVTITSNSCNDLTFEYDYSGMGLGSGEKRMKRLFSLETAGHDCRDFEARVEANNQ